MLGVERQVERVEDVHQVVLLVGMAEQLPADGRSSSPPDRIDAIARAS